MYKCTMYNIVYLRKELHKYINTDEAAAMGSSFMAASSSSVFRTKEIKLKDANQFPFFVAFNKLILNDEGTFYILYLKCHVTEYINESFCRCDNRHEADRQRAVLPQQWYTPEEGHDLHQVYG